MPRSAYGVFHGPPGGLLDGGRGHR